MNVLLCPFSSPGYVYPAIAIGLELRRRGHRVTLTGETAVMSLATASELSFAPAEHYGPRGTFWVGHWTARGYDQYRAVIRAAADADADILVTSVLCHGALLAAEVLDLPVVVIGFAAWLWEYRSGGAGEPDLPARIWRTRDILRYYTTTRAQAGLRPRGGFPLLGQAFLLRGDPALEYPGAELPVNVHHCGPCTWEPRPDPAELSEVTGHLDRAGLPVVYVHLGRVFGGTSPWPMLNAAFTGTGFQAVVELGRTTGARPAPGAYLHLVRQPWMGPLIERSGLVLTSGTTSPVLNALRHGRPLAVSPAGSEQPVLAAACARAGVAVYLHAEDVPRSPGTLRAAWRDHGLRTQAAVLGDRLARADGSSRAADIIESVAAPTAPAGPAGPAGSRSKSAGSRSKSAAASSHA